MQDRHASAPLARLRALDANLLVALDALLCTGSVTGAASRCGVTQPAMSRMLVRLRAVFGDPLLVKAGRSLAPTPYAVRLRPRLRDALLQLEASIAGPGIFDPKSARRTFHLATVDYVQAVMLPSLLERISQTAPGIDVVAHDLASATTKSLLDGAIDVVISPRRKSLTDLVWTKLFTDELVCIVRRDHPSVGETLSVDDYCRLAHVLVAPGNAPSSLVDDALAAEARTRRVVARVPNFLVAPRLVAATDYVATVVRKVAEDAVASLPVRIVPCPLPLRASVVSLGWHERMQNDLGHTWFRREIVEIVRAEATRHSVRTQRAPRR